MADAQPCTGMVHLAISGSSSRNIDFRAAASLGKWPRLRTALRITELTLSIALVVYISEANFRRKCEKRNDLFPVGTPELDDRRVFGPERTAGKLLQGGCGCSFVGCPVDGLESIGHLLAIAIAIRASLGPSLPFAVGKQLRDLFRQALFPGCDLAGVHPILGPLSAPWASRRRLASKATFALKAALCLREALLFHCFVPVILEVESISCSTPEFCLARGVHLT